MSRFRHRASPLWSLLAAIGFLMHCLGVRAQSISAQYGGDTSSKTTVGSGTTWDYVYNVTYTSFPFSTAPTEWGISANIANGDTFSAPSVSGGGVTWTGQYYSNVSAYTGSDNNMKGLFSSGWGAVVWTASSTWSASPNALITYSYTTVNTPPGDSVGTHSDGTPKWDASGSGYSTSSNGAIYTATPEPSTMLLLMLGLMGIPARRFLRFRGVSTTR